jgi:predicted nucleic acid-binding protein
MLALESPQAVVVLDDALARQVAATLGLSFTGTLGLLLDAKKANLIPLVRPVLDQLQALRFRLAPHTRAAILKLAGEET